MAPATLSRFDLDELVAECRAALRESMPRKAVREVVERAVADPGAVVKALGEPMRGGIQKLYHAPDLTILNVIWAPYLTAMPHNHRMWAVIGVYTGREDNILWRRIPGAPAGHIEAAGAKALGVKEAYALGEDVIHSVNNPIPRLTGAIHVYGGDFINIDRSEWDPETLVEKPYDLEGIMRLFEEANARAGIA
jgi:predicted metal-dependent enzyme (double-stranded beta helix superfamily)